MKILLLDVDSCYFCPCSSAEVGWLGNITRSVCQVKGEENTVYMDGVSGVPEWCPLKPMPEKLQFQEPFNDDYTVSWASRLGFVDGWNACIEEIEK